MSFKQLSPCALLVIIGVLAMTTVYAQNISTSPAAPSQSFPDWAPVASVVAGGITLLFLMLVVIMSIFGRVVPPAGRFPVIAVLALGFAMTAAFVGGNAVAKGNLPVPGLQDKPVEFSVAGGIAVFIIVLIRWKYSLLSV
jgi:hypothetical protein